MNKKTTVLIISILFAVIGFLSWKLYSVSRTDTCVALPRETEQPQFFALSVIDTIASKELNETRTINVYLPEGYSPDSAATYPVIYLLDGGIGEDFVHITGIVRHNTQPWIARFPRSIVVGIENTLRRRDFTFAVPNLDFLEPAGFKKEQFPAYGGSAKFISFIEKELQPFIEKKYKTNAGKTITGESLGGLLATEILLKHRHLFDTYIIISPSLWWNNQSLLAEAPDLLNKGTDKKVKVYIAAANKDENKGMYDDAVFLDQLLKKHAGKNLQVHFDYLSDETHATIFHQAVYNAFRTLYPKTAVNK
ncbi:MAG: alpha/beta hydrolase [Bacteroidetes bacterium]|jgi:predicted alpha/beta superfamily hydrolase|nr:alpha/beta hydrolase [Bacteroidota bacterium]